jgi:hypothetical protein
MTFAFGMNDRFVPSFDRTDDVIRFALMEKKGNGATFAQQAARIDRIRSRPNVTVAVGHHIEINRFDRWLAELDRIVGEAHVHVRPHQVHARADPLGPSPVVSRRLGQLLRRLDARQRRETCSSSAATRRSPTSISASSCACSATTRSASR